MKQYQTHKRQLVHVLLIAVLPILLYACRKELHLIKNTGPSLTIEEAKSYMATRERIKIPKDQITFSSFTDKGLLFAWDRAKVSVNGQQESVEVPLVNRNKGYVIGANDPSKANKSITTLVVTKDERGELTSFLMTLVADPAYLTNKPDDLKKNGYKKFTPYFSGFVLLHKPEGVFISGERYLGGQRIGALLPVPDFEIKATGSASSGGKKVMNYALPGDEDCTYYTMWDYNATCYPVGADVYCEWEASIRWTYRVCSGTSGGGGGTGGGNTQDPYSINNELALPCENVGAANLADTIYVRDSIGREAVKHMLPPEYHSFIKFDANGHLDKTILASAGSVANMPQSNIYNALLWLAQQPTVNVDVFLSSSWIGRTTEDPLGNNYSYLTTNQIIEGITVVPGEIPLEGVPVTGFPRVGKIYIEKGVASSGRRLAYVTAHELLGHMYSYIKSLPFTHGNPTFDSWVNSIEVEANKNWKLIKKWKKSKEECPD